MPAIISNWTSNSCFYRSSDVVRRSDRFGVEVRYLCGSFEFFFHVILVSN